MKTLISIAIPVYNESGNIERLIARLDSATAELDRYDFEFVFTDNASTDDTFALLSRAAEADDRIRVYRFTRNFGFQKSILTNYLLSEGDAVIQIDADLQDPPELFGDFLEKWESGYKVVYGVRRKRRESWWLNSLREVGYAAIDRLSEVPVPRNAGDFRLLDRSVLNELRHFSDQAPYLRGMVALLGHKHAGVEYDRDERKAGQSKFGLPKLISLGIDGVCSQSTKLLRIITVTGFAMAMLTALAAVFYFVLYLVGGIETQGFTTITLLLLFSIAMNAIFTGIVGEYVGRIFSNTRQMPLSLVEQQVGTGKRDPSAPSDGAARIVHLDTPDIQNDPLS